MGLVVLEHIYKEYCNKKSKVNALTDVSFSFNEKGLYFIKGKSGSGKSTILNLLNGDITEYTGNIYVNGIELKKYKSMDYYRNSIVATIYQEKNLIDHLTIYDNIKFVLDLQNKTDDGVIEEVAKKVGILELLKYYPNELSGGERQKATIARALVKGSSIILADEITSNLDSESRNDVMKLIKEIAKDKLVIMVCHDNELIDEYADYILKIENGKLLSDFKIEEVKKTKLFYLSNPHFKFKYIIKGLLNIIKLKPIRLFITLIILIGVGSVAGALFNLCTTNKGVAHLEQYDNGKHQDLMIRYGLYDDGDFTSYKIDDKALELFQKKLTGVKFNNIYGYYINNFNEINDNDSSLDPMLYYPSVCYTGMMEIDEKVSTENGFSLLAGNYPTQDYEVVITEYCYEAFKKYGYASGQSMLGAVVEPIRDHNDLIGKKLIIYEKEFVVSGIIKTNSMLEIFDDLKTKTEFSNEFYPFRTYIFSSIDTIVFTNSGFIENSDLKLDLNRLYIGKNNLDRNVFNKALKLNFSKNYFAIDGLVFQEVEMNINNIRDYGKVALLILSIFVIFLIALLINYFNYTFTVNHKFIGIYRSLGVKKIQIISIYMLLGIIIFIISNSISYPLIKNYVDKYDYEIIKNKDFLVSIFQYDLKSFIVTSIIFLMFSIVPFFVLAEIKLNKDNYYILNMRD